MAVPTDSLTVQSMISMYNAFWSDDIIQNNQRDLAKSRATLRFIMREVTRHGVTGNIWIEVPPLNTRFAESLKASVLLLSVICDVTSLVPLG